MRVWVALPALLCASCITLSWERNSSYRSPAGEAVTQLTVGKATLKDCLDALGAPLIVDEYGPGMVLYWGWSRQSGWNLSGRVPVSESASASLSYGEIDLNLNALMITFEADMRVEMLRYGRLADLLNIAARRRPQLLEEEDVPK
jgi:hypothetical protein